MPAPPRVLAGQSSLLSQDLVTYYRQVSHSQLTVVDLETSGIKAQKARVIEISVLQADLENGIHHQETQLINPSVKLPAIVTEVTGITPAMVGQGRWPEDVWPDFLPLLEQGVLTAHNLEFDYSFIQSEYRHLGFRFVRPPEERFCTVLLSRLLLADLPSRSLPDLVKHFDFNVGPSHRAEADTKACWLLAERLLSQIRDSDDEELIAHFSRQWVRLQDAAKMLKHPKSQVRAQLDEWGCECRTSRNSKRFMYRRGDIERLYRQLYDGQADQLAMNLEQ